jgi:acid phosphatase type 7
VVSVMMMHSVRPYIERWSVAFLCFVLSSAYGAAPAAPPTLETTVFAVGDLAPCGRYWFFWKPPAVRVARLTGDSGPILLLGDLAYPNGSKQNFSRCFDPWWGKLKERLLPVPGNHEYQSPDAAPYYRYFGERAGALGLGYYAVQVGSWRIIALNSNIDVEAGSAQKRWLKQELAAHPAPSAF